jgi:hypothetical protein
MKKITSGGLAALMVLAANAMAGTPNTTPNCTKEKCLVNVMVNGNTCGGGIALSPDPLITAAKSGPITITWKIVGDWEFDKENGINIVEAGKDFELRTKLKDTWTATTNTSTHMVWRYDVNLVRKVGDKVEKCSRDPTIINH